MVDWNSFGSIALRITILVISIIVVGGFMGVATFAYLKWRRFSQFACKVFERDGFGQMKLLNDRAGIFVDAKTKNKRFFMKKFSVGLEPDNIPYIQDGKRKVVYLLRTGLKNFHFIRFNISNPSVYLSVGEEDVNWAINAYERQKKLFSQSLLMQLLPFMLIAFVSIIILVMFIYFFKEFATLKLMAVALREAAASIAQASSGTTVISGG